VREFRDPLGFRTEPGNIARDGNSEHAVLNRVGMATVCDCGLINPHRIAHREGYVCELEVLRFSRPL
jgi:hypothetical protein